MILTPKQIDNYADALLWGLSVDRPRFRKYDVVLVRMESPAALPLAEAINRRLVERRFNVILRTLASPTAEKDFYGLSDPAQRRFVWPGEKELYEGLNGLIALRAPMSLTHLKDIPPGRIGEVTVAKKSLRDILDRREEHGRFSWTLCTWPTEVPARNARLPLKAYASQIVKACFLDDRDTVGRWKSVHRDAMEIKAWLKGLRMRTIRLQTRSMDLEVRLGEHRKFQGVSGRNIPSFEIFTSPDCRGTRGVYYSNLPSFRNGNYVEGIRLEFKDGDALKVSAKKGEEFTRKTLALDPGARRIGELSLTDVRFSKIDKFMADTLFDENFGGPYGNCHIAMGASYSDTFDGDPSKLTRSRKKALGFNDSSHHWDIVNTEDKTVTACLRGGKRVTVYDKGRFKV
ncbi:MAG: aminopeptidase [Elusimicrobiota bacterium]